MSKFTGILFLLLLCEVVVPGYAHYSDSECMSWAIQRIVGSASTEVNGKYVTKHNVTARNDGELMEARARPGKRGHPGSAGERGPIGPQGVCDCIPEEVRELQRENRIMKVKLMDPIQIGNIPHLLITLHSPFSLIAISEFDRHCPPTTVSLQVSEYLVWHRFGEYKLKEIADKNCIDVIFSEQIKQLQRSTDPGTYCLLGLKSGLIGDDAITVSTRTSHTKYGRLDYAGDAWYPDSPSSYHPGTEWIQVDLGKATYVTGVITQGRPTSDSWTTTFKVQHSMDALSFIDFKKADKSEMIFSGNTDRNTQVVNRFPEPVTTRYIRIYPLTHHSHGMIRFDVINC